MYKRNEAFRYIFTHPLDGFLTISMKDGVKKESNKGEIQLNNLSPQGCSFSTHLLLPTKENLIISIEITLNDQPIFLTGSIVWNKFNGKNYLYGFKIEESSKTTKLLTDEIKKYAAKNRK